MVTVAPRTPLVSEDPRPRIAEPARLARPSDRFLDAPDTARAEEGTPRRTKVRGRAVVPPPQETQPREAALREAYYPETPERCREVAHIAHPELFDREVARFVRSGRRPRTKGHAALRGDPVRLTPRVAEEALAEPQAPKDFYEDAARPVTQPQESFWARRERAEVTLEETEEMKKMPEGVKKVTTYAARFAGGAAPVSTGEVMANVGMAGGVTLGALLLAGVL